MTLKRWFSPRRLKVIFYIIVMLILALVGYRIYLIYFEQDFSAVHADQIERVQSELAGKSQLSFTVVGNINNSVGVFERTMIPIINQNETDFLVSAGNAVSGGGEDKYRALYRSLSHLEMPYLLTVGENESSIFGSFHFYEHFGPYFYSFKAGNSQFIFLDTTDPDAYNFQLYWLKQQLLDEQPQHRFVFLGDAFLKPELDSPVDFAEDYLVDTPFGQDLMTLFSRYQVTAVFSSDLHLFDRQEHKGILYIATGGAGGLVLNNDTSFYHYVSVSVDGDNVSIDMKRLDIGQNQLMKTLESLWLFIHSLFYVGRLNFLLVLLALMAVAIKLYTRLFVDRDYYPNFDLDVEPFRNKPLRVLMVTNNYLPFIGGVPISIERLRRGLVTLGHKVMIVSPSYRDQKKDENPEEIVRLRSWMALGKGGEFRMANPISRRARKAMMAFKPEVVHIHHPFWLGWFGLLWAKALRVPAVYTYHTRLEHYAHYVPLPGPLFRNWISHSLVRRFANRCAGVIVPTQSAEEYLRVIGVTTNLYVQPTGIDFERFQQRDEAAMEKLRDQWNISADDCVFVSVSRLSKEKNIGFMIDALAELRRRSARSFKCLLIGDGEERAALQQRIDDKNLSDCVHLVGPVPPDDMAVYYQLGDAFLFASKSETQGMVILEAMAARLPVVAVRSSGIDDVVREGFNGFKTREDRTQWVERVQQLLENDDERERLADQALSFARDFAIDRFAADVAEIYAHVLASEAERKGVRVSAKES
ncbi:glycosyltransferase [Saccharospirillum mangrovi]|uniref:glycosyltransferase n=1 Tax=Saccharospirillum mangrovi TaxID=2161747 RepID=UPI000D3838E0|nr:glycosyltransferase [Saccharospirillum mangrovi]